MMRARPLSAESRGPSRRQERRARPVDAQIGMRLREARRLAGASQRQLAAALGVTAPAVRKYESGARRLPATRLAAAVKFLGVPMSFLFNDQAGLGAGPEAARLSALERELVQCFRAIADDRARARVLAFARSASSPSGPTE